MKHKSEVLSNLLYIGLGDSLSRGFVFVAFMYLARVLGPAKLGLIGFGASAVALFAPVIDYGLGFVGIREVSREPAALKFYIKTILFDRFILGGLALICLIVVSGLFIQDYEQHRIVLLYGLTLLPAILNLTWAYQGIGQTGWFLVEKNIQAILYCAGIYLFVQQSRDFERLPIAYAMSALLPAVAILGYFIRKIRKSRGKFRVDYSLDLLRSSFKLFVPTLLSQVNLSIGLLLVVYFGSLQEAGYFSAASRIIVLTAVIPNLLWSSFYPSLSRAEESNVNPHTSLSAALYKYAVISGIVPLTLGMMFSSELVAIIFGRSYGGAVVPFQLFSIVASLQFLSIVFTRILPAFGKDKAFRKIIVTGAAVQLIVCVALVPCYGASGAAMSYIISEGMIGIAALYVIHLEIQFDLVKWPFVALMTMLVCYAIARAIGLFVSISSVVMILGTVLLYFGFLCTTGVISLKDF